MDSLFSHEFSPAPLSLCDSQNCNLLNQQRKSEALTLFEENFSQCFSTNDPTTLGGKWALIIDGGPMLETKPLKLNGTVMDYARQLLTNNVIPEFNKYDRIDIVFDSDRSKNIKSFTKRHGYDSKISQEYDLKENDILDSSKFHEFVHSNRAKLASAVRSCWSQNVLTDLLPLNKHLIIAGPQQTTIRLINNKFSQSMQSVETLVILESDHVEADTRIFLHVYDVELDNDKGKFNGIVIQSIDTDVFILALAHVKLMMLPNCYVRKFNSSTKLTSFINIKAIGCLLRIKWNITEPTVLLVLHALSGCDSTSFTRNITKKTYFNTYLSNPDQFQHLLEFGEEGEITRLPMKAAEDLLISCYTKSRGYKSLLAKTAPSSSTHTVSLNSLRQNLAIKYCKNQTTDICIKLPPTSESFQQHCKRVWKQVFIWKKTFEPFDLISCYPIEDYGYDRTNNNELIIRWFTNSELPNHLSLSRCVKCTSGCQRCKCAANNLCCTPLCGCSSGECTNRTTIQVMKKSTEATKENSKPVIRKILTFDDTFDDYDDDSETDVYIQNNNCIDAVDGEYDDDGIDDTMQSMYDNYSDAGSDRSFYDSYLDSNESESDLLNLSITSDHSYCYQSTPFAPKCSANAQNAVASSTVLRQNDFNPFQNQISPISSHTSSRKLSTTTTNSNGVNTVLKPMKRKPNFSANTSAQSTPSQIISRKKKL
ncbi:unnamed protein product [Adineta ricciae]|uniref:Tesmin/TSO1-like CXC domain-containing protein n=2 Tax=Adineta ricciae TaxID=249248 RepID=A0A814LGP5_ADIRI|nr:unnamed protein product [Adineta ricciae]